MYVCVVQLLCTSGRLVAQQQNGKGRKDGRKEGRNDCVDDWLVPHTPPCCMIALLLFVVGDCHENEKRPPFYFSCVLVQAVTAIRVVGWGCLFVFLIRLD